MIMWLRISAYGRVISALDRRRPLLDETHDLVELGHEEIERRQDPAVGTEVVSASSSINLQIELAAEHSVPGRIAQVNQETHCFMTSL